MTVAYGPFTPARGFTDVIQCNSALLSIMIEKIFENAAFVLIVPSNGQVYWILTEFQKAN